MTKPDERNVTIADLPELANVLQSVHDIIDEGNPTEYVMARDGLSVMRIKPPLANFSGPIRAELLQAAMEHTASFKQLLEDRGMNLAMVGDPRCELGYFYIGVSRGKDSEQTSVTIHTDKKGWEELGEEIEELSETSFRFRIAVLRITASKAIVKWFEKIKRVLTGK